MNTGLVLVAHSPLGDALCNCAVHVLGGLDGVYVHDVQADDQPDVYVPEVLKDILKADQGQGVLVLTDLVGATPANIAKRAVEDAQSQGVPCCLVAGLNTAMLLRTLTNRDKRLSQLRELALSGGQQAVLRVE